ncbi:MAG: class I SAM-dependent rRNA methyltransferase [Candidatus Borkfalkiaceae bacterium]|nr:class I SAM-dependent rRNA methyltransferase [Christensenellaceae bacterium]
MYTVTLKRNEEKKVLNGYPWIFANEVQKIEGKDKQGSVAEIKAFDGRYVGKGFINHHSKIIVRILTTKSEEINKDFFAEKIKIADEGRRELGYNDNYRVVFGESDNLPGLIVDKYGDKLSVQFLSLGMEVIKNDIVDILVKRFAPSAIYERSDVAIREKEGLPLKKGVIYGKDETQSVIVENGLKLIVDLENGQKTGYFLDQKENRDDLKFYVKDKTVLDCFCNEGGFSLCAKKYGAKEVTAIDISKTAIELVEKNAKLNDLEIKTRVADVFEALREYRKSGEKFGVIVLDPPAFTKTADTVKAGYKGYKDINANALKLVEKGGYLVTCSCSQHLTLPLFLQMIKESVFESGVRAKLVELRTQGKDHAVCIGYDESLYLKVAVIKVL